ncbi:MAG: RNA-directed DNA polymerase [Actinomycetota bacterium]
MPGPGWGNLDFSGAIDRVVEYARRDWVLDLIGHADTIRWLREAPERLGALLEHSYEPHRPTHVPVPKTSLTVRPTLHIGLAERAVVQALVETFAVETLRDVPEWVCGWRFNDGAELPADLAGNSLEWDRYNELLQIYHQSGPWFVLKTDIANFFHHVPLSVLRDSLTIPSPEIQGALFKFLESWAPARVGLPQPMLASSLLANAYLRPVDAVLSSYEAVRWMDDITVFCSSRSEGIRALVRIQDALRRLNLGINAAKTSLAPSDPSEFSTPGFRLGASGEAIAEDPIQISACPPIPPWDEVIDSDEVERRVFGIYARRLPHEKPDRFAREILQRLGRLPHVADHASQYLRAATDPPDVLRRVQDFLKGPDNQFAWQEYRLATLYWHAEELSHRHLAFALSRAKDGNIFKPTRGVYLRAVARHGTSNHAMMIEEMGEHEDDPIMLRSLVLAAAESGHIPHRRVRQMARGEPSLGRLAGYLANRQWRVPELCF